MERGVRYAQENRIDNLTISPGMIFSTVQGTAPTPYRVKINFTPITDEGWETLIEALSKKVGYLISMLENNMPEGIIQIFNKNGFPLFPPPTKELDASCSCPDKAIPCKHIAATILYIARVVDFVVGFDDRNAVIAEVVCRGVDIAEDGSDDRDEFGTEPEGGFDSVVRAAAVSACVAFCHNTESVAVLSNAA